MNVTAFGIGNVDDRFILTVAAAKGEAGTDLARLTGEQATYTTAGIAGAVATVVTDDSRRFARG